MRNFYDLWTPKTKIREGGLRGSEQGYKVYMVFETAKFKYVLFIELSSFQGREILLHFSCDHNVYLFYQRDKISTAKANIIQQDKSIQLLLNSIVPHT